MSIHWFCLFHLLRQYTGSFFFTRCVNTLVLSFLLAVSIHWFCLFHLLCQYTGSLFFTCCVNTLVLSFSLAASIHSSAQSYSEQQCNNSTMLRLLLLYLFWQAEICICHKPRTTRDEMRVLQIAPPRTLMLPFFILPALHTQDTFALVLSLEVGHFARHFLLLSFFLLVLLWKEFIPHSFVVTFYFSRSSGLPPVFLSSRGWLLDSHKRWLFCLHIKHATRYRFERRTPVSLSEAAVFWFCFSISLQTH